MPCTPCEARRRILAEARANDGIKGMVRAIPAVGRHLLANPPKLKDDEPSKRAGPE